MQSNDEMSELAEMVERGERSYKQYRTGDYGTAKAALLDYISYLESKLEDRSFVHIETAKLDIMTNYARLAKLEEKNNGPEKEAFMQKAIAICMQVIKGK